MGKTVVTATADTNANIIAFAGQNMPEYAAAPIETKLTPTQQQALEQIFRGFDLNKVAIASGIPVQDLRLLAQSDDGMRYLARCAIRSDIRCQIRDEQMDFMLDVALRRLAGILTDPKVKDNTLLSAVKDVLDRHQSRRFTKTSRVEQTVTGRVHHDVASFRNNAVSTLARFKGIPEAELRLQHDVPPPKQITAVVEAGDPLF